ncbi:MAG TPA: GDP-mannose 4,6-dehydratase [Solirubrobacteraceae bacterium]|nr:GDP-mannose 4,6-dehydratase [Solirubrobacteraceae bacterium]
MKIAALVRIEGDFWRRRRVLVTGHTGFKGAWLSLWLQSLGAHVTGLARGVPTQPSLYELARVGEHMDELSVDVRDAAGVRAAVRAVRPEVVLHLAAQPLVRRSLREPALTFEVNVMGTANVLEAVRQEGAQVRAIVAVTSDKCYENPDGGPLPDPVGDSPPEAVGGSPPDPDGGSRRFTEQDRLGGADPYSSSKACAELVAAAYRSSYFHGGQAPALASARAGNVIGGGDWGEDRLVPDAVRAVERGELLRVRNPEAVRPWQHVLSPLAGYLLLAQALTTEGRARYARAWNFGPAAEDERTVGAVIERLRELWDGELRWQLDAGENPPEAARLALDSSAAARLLGWRAPWPLESALARIVEWHRAHRAGGDMRAVSVEQIESTGIADFT